MIGPGVGLGEPADLVPSLPILRFAQDGGRPQPIEFVVSVTQPRSHSRGTLPTGYQPSDLEGDLQAIARQHGSGMVHIEPSDRVARIAAAAHVRGEFPAQQRLTLGQELVGVGRPLLGLDHNFASITTALRGMHRGYGTGARTARRQVC